MGEGKKCFHKGRSDLVIKKPFYIAIIIRVLETRFFLPAIGSLNRDIFCFFEE